MDESSTLPSSKWLSVKQPGSPTFGSRSPGAPSPLFQKLLGARSISNTKESIQLEIADHVNHLGLTDTQSLDNEAAYQAAALSVRKRLITELKATQQYFNQQNPKRVFYLCIEYLLGRTMRNAIVNLGVENVYGDAIKELGYHLEDLYEEELDAGLGNGGLGRLAACYLDSVATENFPAMGYGLRYTYGMFKQEFKNGFQHEKPDIWCVKQSPWEVVKYKLRYRIRFHGHSTVYEDEEGFSTHGWEGGTEIWAVAHDIPINGYNTMNTIPLRLWNSEPIKAFDLTSFNEADYYKAIKERQSAENITNVLYPNDNTERGKELRLKQQYFFASATLQDILAHFKKQNKDLDALPEKVIIQLNDTHPVISIPELMRLLLDVERLTWDESYEIVSKVFAYTNHTVLPEALEKWSVPLLAHLLPRHVEIIYEINHRFLEWVRTKYPGDNARLGRVSIVEESTPKTVRMAYLACIVCSKVNGVAEIHSEILKKELFRDFYELYPEKFVNVTNGITPRRWLVECNPDLNVLIKGMLKSGQFATHLDQLSQLKQFSSVPEFQDKWMNIKMENKRKLARFINDKLGIEVDPARFMFDIHVKRIHEYKRQLMNILRVIVLYKDIKRKVLSNDTADILPKMIMFAGKAAPGYYRAKQVIKLINSVASVVNSDDAVAQYLKVVFLPNYNVSLAELIVPACDLSQQISTAGTEASGTSNMKFALNGGVIIGTMDGANIEIRDQIGHENMFVFGLTADQVSDARKKNSTKPNGSYADPRFALAIKALEDGEFGPSELYKEVLDTMQPRNDFYLLGDDFASYLDCLAKCDAVYKDKRRWAKMSIEGTAGSGLFSADRSVQQYAERIWGVKACKVVS